MFAGSTVEIRVDSLFSVGSGGGNVRRSPKIEWSILRGPWIAAAIMLFLNVLSWTRCLSRGKFWPSLTKKKKKCLWCHQNHWRVIIRRTLNIHTKFHCNLASSARFYSRKILQLWFFTSTWMTQLNKNCLTEIVLAFYPLTAAQNRCVYVELCKPSVTWCMAEADPEWTVWSTSSGPFLCSRANIN